MSNVIATGGGGGVAEIPIASADTLGGVKIGTGVNVTDDGTISVIQYLDPAVSYQIWVNNFLNNKIPYDARIRATKRNQAEPNDTFTYQIDISSGTNGSEPRGLIVASSSLYMWIWKEYMQSNIYHIKTYSGCYYGANSSPLTFTSSNFLGWYTQYFTNSNTLNMFTTKNQFCYYINTNQTIAIPSGITLVSGLFDWITNTISGINSFNDYELRVEEITYNQNYLWLPFYWGYDNSVYSNMQPNIYIYL